jgi:menaquinone-specific isochorismate synthase
VETHLGLEQHQVSCDGTLTGAVAALVEELRCASNVCAQGNQVLVWRFETELVDADVLSWVQSQKQGVRLYWSARDKQDATAGVGVAYEISDGLPPIDSSSTLRFFGGTRFDIEQTPGDIWRNFGRARFVLPQIELSRRDGHTMLACHMCTDETVDFDSSRYKLIALLRGLILESEPVPASTAKLINSGDELLSVDKVMGQIQSGDVDKVVLAKRLTLTSSKPLDAFELLKRLKAKVPLSYHFCFQFESGQAFVGASPEQLYARSMRRIDSEAQAGTRVRGQTPDEDAVLELELMASDKDRREHELVLLDIDQTMSKLCIDHGVRDNRQVIKLPNVQHLRSRLSGILNESMTDQEILQALHPTPAVCGTPRAKAMQVIRDCESFDRGYYAGPIGYVSGVGAEFAVALRSGLVEGHHIHLFAGAGIVMGSVADEETREIANKLSLWIDLLK